MHSRKLSGLILSVLTLSVLVALLLSSTVQLSQRRGLVTCSPLVADGSPMPIPRPPAQPTLVADGVPIPPLPPPKSPTRPTVVADGTPIPPLPPPKRPPQTTVVADGTPIPPLPPPSPKLSAAYFHV